MIKFPITEEKNGLFIRRYKIHWLLRFWRNLNCHTCPADNLRISLCFSIDLNKIGLLAYQILVFSSSSWSAGHIRLTRIWVFKLFLHALNRVRSRVNVVRLVRRLRAGCSKVLIPVIVRAYLFSRTPKPALGRTQPPVPCTPGFFPGGKSVAARSSPLISICRS